MKIYNWQQADWPHFSFSPNSDWEAGVYWEKTDSVSLPALAITFNVGEFYQ